MNERDKLIELLEEVKQKIRMLDAIEGRLLIARDLIITSTEVDVLDAEKGDIQKQIDELMAEVKLLYLEETMHQ